MQFFLEYFDFYSKFFQLLRQFFFFKGSVLWLNFKSLFFRVGEYISWNFSFVSCQRQSLYQVILFFGVTVVFFVEFRGLLKGLLRLRWWSLVRLVYDAVWLMVLLLLVGIVGGVVVVQLRGQVAVDDILGLRFYFVFFCWLGILYYFFEVMVGVLVGQV